MRKRNERKLVMMGLSPQVSTLAKLRMMEHMLIKETFNKGLTAYLVDMEYWSMTPPKRMTSSLTSRLWLLRMELTTAEFPFPRP